MEEAGEELLLALSGPSGVATMKRRPKRGEGGVHTYTVECVSGVNLKEKCVRVIEIEEWASVYDLHDAIQDAVQFRRDHPFEFFTAASLSPSSPRRWLTMEKEWDDKVRAFVQIRLRDLWPMGRRKLYYWFDFFDRWIFEIRKAPGTRRARAGVSYPRVISAVGPTPDQYPPLDE